MYSFHPKTLRYTTLKSAQELEGSKAKEFTIFV